MPRSPPSPFPSLSGSLFLSPVRELTGTEHAATVADSLAGSDRRRPKFLAAGLSSGQADLTVEF
jgi:hypothetical protein